MTNGSGDMTSAFASALESASSTPVSEASPASQPATETTPAETTPAAAIAQPAATDPATASVSPAADAIASTTDEGKPTGEPPKWRWQDILENARKTSAQEAEQRIKQEYDGKLKGLEPFSQLHETERAGMLVWHRALSGDPEARAMVAQADQKLAASLGWTSTSAAESEPEADLQTADGTPVYSAPQLRKWQEWNARKLTADVRSQVQKDLGPVQSVVRAHQESQAQTTVAGVIAKMTTADPEFKSHVKAVLAELQADPALWAMADSVDQMPYAVETAWHRVYRRDVLPTKEKTAEATVLANLKQKALAGSANPNAPAASTPPAFKPGERGFAEALAHFGGTAA